MWTAFAIIEKDAYEGKGRTKESAAENAVVHMQRARKAWTVAEKIVYVSPQGEKA